MVMGACDVLPGELLELDSEREVFPIKMFSTVKLETGLLCCATTYLLCEAGRERYCLCEL